MIASITYFFYKTPQFSQQNSSLTLAAINNWPSVVQTLLSLDCRIIANNEGYTPIDYAIINKNTEVAMAMVMHSKRYKLLKFAKNYMAKMFVKQRRRDNEIED